MTIPEARRWMRDEFGPDSKLVNEDGSPMSEAQLDEAAKGWIEYFDMMNAYFRDKVRP